ncbi:MAG: ParB/RepB/Spo0J family partition protein [Chloroflexota bacterium]|nr:ParB/RepB/Spo0J family partition protein [Chloroflexota bacterium]
MPASRRRPPAPIDPRGRDHTTATPAELAQTAERGWDRLERARKIPIERLAPNPDNPRTHYDDLGPLADSIAVRGLLLPLLVRADPDRPGYYLVIAGSRRLLASRMVDQRDDPTARARVRQLPCLIADSDDRDAFADALLENMGRQDLSRPEMMAAVKRLRDEFSFSGAEIARRTGRNQSDISALLRLADDQELASLVMDERLPASNATIIQRLPEEERREVVAAVRSGRDFTTEELRVRARAGRRPPEMAAEEMGGDGSPPNGAPGGVVNSLARGRLNAPHADNSRTNGPVRGLVNSLPRDGAPIWPARGSGAGGGRLRPELVTLNNLAREIEAFCDRHDPGRFTDEEAAPLARAADRLVAHLQRARRQ